MPDDASQAPLFPTEQPLPAPLAPLLKWPGGKTGELPFIQPALPADTARVVEPFVGGGAVFLANPHLPAVVNDASADLAAFYRRVQEQDRDFFALLDAADAAWCALDALADEDRLETARAYRSHQDGALDLDAVQALAPRDAAAARPILLPLIERLPGVGAADLDRELARNLASKIGRMARVEARRGRMPAGDIAGNIEGALKSALYMTLRTAYNRSTPAAEPDVARVALFWFLREYAYAAMFRYNKQGGFNVPYGGMSYNRKTMGAKLARMRSAQIVERLARTRIHHQDFEAFLDGLDLGAGDLLFFDPPYDSDFSTYDSNAFGAGDQRRLAGWIHRHAAQVRFMVVVKQTPLMEELYGQQGYRIRSFDKKYMWTIKERNDRDALHMMVTNYPDDAQRSPSDAE